MAQLIKLEDCVSRYEQDIYRYTGQYIRLKRDRWNRVKVNWENNQVPKEVEPIEELPKSTKWWNRKRKEQESEESNFRAERQDHRSFSRVKEDFREELFQFQLKWASATIREKSKFKSSTEQDPFLRFLLKELPDNYLVLYKPVIQMKNAQTQLDIFLIGPDSIQAIVLLKAADGGVVSASENRFWEIETQGEKHKIISPISAVQRMNYFIESVIDKKTIEMNITYTILASKAYVNRSGIPPYIHVIDAANYAQWMQKIKRQPSPIKFNQLKAAKSILDHCVTTAYLRPEWESDEEQWGHIPSE